MTTATLDHPLVGQLDLPILGESGDPLISRDFGKPHVQFRKTGELNPTPTIDAWNNLVNYSIQTELVSDSAYDDALVLADMMKSMTKDHTGTALTLDVPLNEYPSDVSVVPSAENKKALTLTYEPGRTGWVGVDLGLTRISAIQGSDAAKTARTPRATGDGPITFQTGSERVELGTDVTIQRSVGRPKDPLKKGHRDYPKAVVKQKATYDCLIIFASNFFITPKAVVKQKATYDAFSIDLRYVNDAPSKVDELRSLFETRRGREQFTLDFNGVYGMGQFTVMPEGSAALRHVRRAAEGNTIVVPTIDLRVTGT